MGRQKKKQVPPKTKVCLSDGQKWQIHSGSISYCKSNRPRRWGYGCSLHQKKPTPKQQMPNTVHPLAAQCPYIPRNGMGMLVLGQTSILKVCFDSHLLELSVPLNHNGLVLSGPALLVSLLGLPWPSSWEFHLSLLCCILYLPLPCLIPLFQ